MVRLTRTVRFAVNPPGLNHPGLNGCGGNPPLRGLGPFYELDVHCRGEVNPATGYLINIKTIDAAVRTEVLPLLVEACWPVAHDGTPPRLSPSPTSLLPVMLETLRAALPVEVTHIAWRLSPYDSLEMHTDRPKHALLRRRFDFAASHRLQVEGWSEVQNREAFGKCAHINGHGHNYEIEPAIELPLSSAHAESGDQIESIVHETIIDRYDHKHLNMDTEEFGPSGLNPSVENIAKVCFERLTESLAVRMPEARLRSITAWETPRTSATYPPA